MTTIVDHQLNDMFERTKGNLFFKKGAGFLGSLLAQVKFRWESEIPTAAISHKELIWNPDFFRSLDKPSRITVLAHELWHNALAHGLRRGDRCPDIWNIAADHVINLLLKAHGYDMSGFPYIMDDKYIGWSTEAVYDDLIAGGMKPNQGQQIPGLGKDVIEAENQEEIDVGMAQVITAFTQAQITCEPGTVPGEVELIIDAFLNPKLPWEVLLFDFFNQLVEQEYSYARPNRRYDDPLLPGTTGRNGLDHLVYFVDVSGSTSDEMVQRMNSEVKFIQDELGPERLTLITFDTKIQDVFEFERDEDFQQIKIHGRGGTSLEEPWEYLRKHQPTAAVVFTDMWVDIPPNPGIPIIWVCVNNPEFEPPEYGAFVTVED